MFPLGERAACGACTGCFDDDEELERAFAAEARKEMAAGQYDDEANEEGPRPPPIQVAGVTMTTQIKRPEIVDVEERKDDPTGSTGTEVLHKFDEIYISWQAAASNDEDGSGVKPVDTDLTQSSGFSSEASLFKQHQQARDDEELEELHSSIKIEAQLQEIEDDAVVDTVDVDDDAITELQMEEQDIFDKLGEEDIVKKDDKGLNFWGFATTFGSALTKTNHIEKKQQQQKPNVLSPSSWKAPTIKKPKRFIRQEGYNRVGNKNESWFTKILQDILDSPCGRTIL